MVDEMNFDEMNFDEMNSQAPTTNLFHEF